MALEIVIINSNPMIKDQLVYISSPSSYSALLGVSTAAVWPHDDGTIYTGSAGLALLFIKLG